MVMMNYDLMYESKDVMMELMMRATSPCLSQ